VMLLPLHNCAGSHDCGDEIDKFGGARLTLSQPKDSN